MKTNTPQTRRFFSAGKEGKLINASYRLTYPEKNGTYPGYEDSFRFLSYDAEMNPVSAGWGLRHE